MKKRLLSVLLLALVADAEGSRCVGLSTVDVSSYVEKGGEEEERVATRVAFDRAMREVGMVCVEGHGVPSGVIERVEEEARRYFDSAAKTSNARYGSEGFVARGVESVGRSNKNASIDRQPDAVESFVFRSRPPQRPEDDPERTGLQAIEESWCAAARAYWDAVRALFDALLHVTADVFGVDAAQFLDAYDGDPSFALRFAHYPRGLPDVKRYGLHTDYLTFTVLRATQPGLQVRLRDGTFADVLPDPATLVVNAADLTELWTNGAWRSAPHHVLPGSSTTQEARHSIAFFTGPSSDFLVTPLPVGPTRLFDPVVAGDYLHGKINPTTVVDDPPSGGGVCDDDASSSSESRSE